MRNSLTELKTEEARQQAYDKAVANHEYAYDENMHQFLLRDVPVQRVEYIGAAWRVQRIFNQKITEVRGKNFVLEEELPIHEKNKYVYYKATPVSENCYGYFTFGNSSKIVAKFEGKYGTLWAYGDTIAETRAFLGIALADRHMETILRLEGRTK